MRTDALQSVYAIQTSYRNCPLGLSTLSRFREIEHEVAYDVAMMRLDWLFENEVPWTQHEEELLEALARRVLHRATFTRLIERIIAYRIYVPGKLFFGQPV
jgi:hypothetical protein